MEREVAFGRYRFEPGTGRLWVGKREVRLTPKAAAVLAVLVGRAGQPVTREELFASVWGDTVVGDATLTTCIRELRAALEDDARCPRFIETRHRRGYRFVARLAASVGHENGSPSSPPVVLRRPPFVVGRDRELAQLRDSLERARAGERQVVFVTGEPGIGKTTLVEAFLADLTADAGPRVVHGRCIEHYGVSEAYLPLLDAMTRRCRERDGEHTVRLLRRHAPTWLVQMPSVVTPAELRSLQRQAVGVTQERMLRELAEAVEALAKDGSLVVWLDDLHWSDLSTVDWLAYLAHRPEPARLLVLGSYRAGEALAREHPIQRVKDELEVRGRCGVIPVPLLDERAIAEYLARRSSAPSHGELARAIHRRTGGNPLFVVSIADELVRTGVLAERGDGWDSADCEDLVGVMAPDDVRKMIGLQLDRLSAEDRRILEAASAAGAEFSAAAAAAGAQTSLAAAESCCAALVQRESFLVPRGTGVWPDGTVAGRYGFRHTLYRESVYERLPAASRAEIHRRIGERLEDALGTGTGEAASELALHFERGGDFGRAIRHLHAAGEIAARRGAAREAVAQLTRALDLLGSQPAGPERTLREIELRIALGAPLMAVRGRGAPEVEEVYTRAQALCEQVDEAPGLFPAIWGLFLFRRSRGEISAALELGERLLALAQRGGDPGLLLEAHHALWATRFAHGDLIGARDHALQGIALYDADRHATLATVYGNHDAGVCAHSHGAWALALLGDADAAVAHTRDAIALARRLEHGFSEAHALLYAARVHQLLGEPQTTREYAERARALARQSGFVQLVAWADVMRGWALAEAGEIDTGVTTMQDGIAEIRALGSREFLTYFLSLLAEGLARAGQTDPALAVATEALAISEGGGERFYTAELRRVKGELLHAAGADLSEAAGSVRAAVETARQQHARALECRALASLHSLGVERLYPI
jgi:DNA-binding winged helix-turn-helix (wHTH) protein/predicted ATPase